MKPKKRHTKSRSRKRKSAISLKPIKLSTCPKCKRSLKPHIACSFCGTYKEKKVLKIKIKKADRKKKIKEEKKAKKQEKKK